MPSPLLHWSSRLAEGGVAPNLGLAVAALAIGRVCLAHLPSGRFAERGPSVWSTSFLVGCGVLTLIAEATGDPFARALWVTLGAFVVAGGLRWILGPHALTPGRAIESPELGPADLTARVATWAAASVPIWREPSDELAWLTSASLCAAATIHRHGLTVARRKSLASELASASLVIVSLVAIERNLSLLAPILAISVSTAAVVAWWRRADRRALALAALGFAVMIRFEPTTWWAGALALLVSSAKPARRTALKTTLAAALLLAVATFTIGPARTQSNPVAFVEPSSLERIVFGALGALAACGVFAALTAARRVRRSSTTDSFDADFPSAESRGLALFLTFAAGFWFAAETLPWAWAEPLARGTWTDLAAVLAPAVLALAALVFVPPERA